MIFKKDLKQSKTVQNIWKRFKTVQNRPKLKTGQTWRKTWKISTMWGYLALFFPTLYSKLYNHDITVKDSDSEKNCSLLPLTVQ